MHISTIIHVHVSHTPCLSAATAPGGDLSKMLLPDKTGGETTMVNGEYDCAPMLATGTKGQNIGPNRHPLRDFENVPHTPLQLTPDSILIESNATHTSGGSTIGRTGTRRSHQKFTSMGWETFGSETT